MKSGSKLFIVVLAQPYAGNSIWAFGSKSAIFDFIPSEIIGITRSTFQNKKMVLDVPYKLRTGNYIIMKEIIRKASKKTMAKNLKNKGDE